MNLPVTLESLILSFTSQGYYQNIILPNFDKRNLYLLKQNKNAVHCFIGSKYQCLICNKCGNFKGKTNSAFNSYCLCRVSSLKKKNYFYFD